MELRAGYRQTEVGVIPGDWEVKKLGEIADIRSGGTPSTNQQQFWDGNVLWCTPTDITSLNGHKYLRDTSRKITQIGLKNSSAEMIPANSIVMTSRATIGECAINTPPVSTNQGFKNFLPFDFVDVEFLYYLLLMQKRRFISLCAGSTFLEIGKVQLNSFDLQLPTNKAEQTAIATALSDVDALIQSLEKLIAKKRAIKQGAMQELLTPKEGWVLKKFKDKDVTELITCGIAATPEYVDENIGVAFLSSTNVKNGKINWNNFKYISKDLHKQLYKNNPPLKGDILYSRVGTIGEAAIIDVDFEFSIYVSLTLIKKGNLINNEFLKQLLNSPKYKTLANNTVLMGGGVGNLNVNVVREFPISFPSIDEQTRIATILSDMDAEIAAMETKLAKYRQIKEGMMQNLLTGRIRLV